MLWLLLWLGRMIGLWCLRCLMMVTGMVGLIPPVVAIAMISSVTIISGIVIVTVIGIVGRRLRHELFGLEFDLFPSKRKPIQTSNALSKWISSTNSISSNQQQIPATTHAVREGRTEKNESMACCKLVFLAGVSHLMRQSMTN